jgi:hypothetical protein
MAGHAGRRHPGRSSTNVGAKGPVLFGQWTAATGTPAALAAGGANRRPLLVKPASLLSLLVKFGLDGLDGPRRSDQ